MEKISENRKPNVDVLSELEDCQWRLECAVAAIHALRVADENMDTVGVTGKALFVIQDYLVDLAHKQEAALAQV